MPQQLNYYPHPPPDRRIECTECGTKVPRTSRYCLRCGAEIDHSTLAQFIFILLLIAVAMSLVRIFLR